MRAHYGCLGLVALCLFSGQVSAQSLEQTSFIFRRPAPCDICATPASGPVTVVPAEPSTKDQAPVVDPQAFAQAPAAGGEAGLSFNPAMFGDLGLRGFGRVFSTIVILPVTQTIKGPLGTIVVVLVPGRTVTSVVQVPILGPGSYKIADNESPRPTDRVFVTYNYFDRVEGLNLGLNREVIGFEKTFLDGDASFEVRLPFLQTSGGNNFTALTNHEVGDMTLISKFAFINDETTGNVLSGGLALTVPSADHSVVLVDGKALRSVLCQPWLGWIYNSGSFFAHGFTSLVVPTDSRDVTEFDNDVGIGYWIYSNPDGFLRGIVPTFEGHLYTPLNHRNNADLIYAPNIVTLTAGVNFVMARNSTLGCAIATPITGPRPDNIEALVSFNVRF
jgi:hypothetical protein